MILSQKKLVNEADMKKFNSQLKVRQIQKPNLLSKHQETEDLLNEIKQNNQKLKLKNQVNLNSNKDYEESSTIHLTIDQVKVK